jgi:hypothetical protein
MVRLTDHELVGLLHVAEEIRNSMEEFGFTVDAALSQHDAFGRNRVPGSSLERSLILEAARKGASQAGLGIDEESGKLEIITSANLTMRYFRIKSVTVKADGGVSAICGRGSSLLVRDHSSLYDEEKWIIGYTLAEDHMVERLFTAEVVSWLEKGSGPVELVLGPLVDLTQTTPPRGFTSSDEGLEGFEGEAGATDVG